MSSVEVRLARPDEYAVIGELSYAAYAADYEIGDDYGHTLRHPELRAADYEIWVAAEQATGELLGTTSTLRHGVPESRGRALADELYFRLLAVAPAARRRGIGARLTTHTIDLARERGLRAVALNSGENMVGAHALYRSLGFERIPERDVVFEGEHPHTVFTFARLVEA
ncbi:GNAT family N-acetyltransferase [Gryllotalpicola koreensis]|uniref:N-acetyltransferase domain-containing protein n=1 Tax=Gryllotalpicola koreensis TaxID=993086 RepID=A0ABP8ACQ6_9MICO